MQSMSPAGAPLSALPNKGLGCPFLSAEGQPPHSLNREQGRERGTERDRGEEIVMQMADAYRHFAANVNSMQTRSSVLVIAKL